MKAIKTKLGKIVATIVVIAIFLAGIVGYIGWYNFFREVPTYYESSAEHFKYGSIGTEKTQGIPYWIWLVLPRLFPEYLPGSGGYTSLGLTWEEGKETPVGISKKTIGFPRQGMNCAVCHTATYRTSPQDKPTIVPAGVASKFNSQAYLRFLFDSANDPRFTPDYILDSIAYNYQFSWLEKQLYRYFIIPQTKKALLKQQQSLAWMDKKPNWGNGRVDFFNPVKYKTLDLPIDDTIGNADIMPLWNQKHQEFAYHWDGLSTSLTETNRLNAIATGATKKSLDLESLQRVEDYLTNLDSPKYPFAIDSALAEKGSQIFNNSCASCHALNGDRTGTVIPLEEIKTDPHRLDTWTQAATDAYNQFAEDSDLAVDKLRKTNGYLAVSLEGLWLRSPYLHNGSVPTLRDLLETPANRPPSFYRGYDVYDSEKVGFVAEKDKAEIGFKYDTSFLGNSNQGHLYGTDLSNEEKTALIEYLKTL